MHPKTALEQLEAARPGDLDWEDPDLAAAFEIVDNDSAARELFEQRQVSDRMVGEAVRAVAIPEGLKDRLHAAVAAKTEIASAKNETPPSQTRQILRTVAIAVLTCSFVLGFWFIQSRTPQLELAEVQSEIPFESDELAGLPRFEGSFDPILPSGGWLDERRISFGTVIKGFPTNAAPHTLAVREFRFRDPRDSRRSDLRGVLVTIPSERLNSVPEGRSFMDGTYRSMATRHGLAIRSWQEDGLVYVCLVPISQQEALIRALEVRPV